MPAWAAGPGLIRCVLSILWLSALAGVTGPLLYRVKLALGNIHTLSSRQGLFISLAWSFLITMSPPKSINTCRNDSLNSQMSGLYESQKKIEIKLSKWKRLLITLIILRNVFILSVSLCLVVCMKEVSNNIKYLFICIIKCLLRHIHNLLHVPALVFTSVCWMQVLLPTCRQ